MPMLLIENTQMQRQTSAAVESARNESVRDNEENRRLLKQVTTAILQNPIAPIQIETVDEPINKIEGTNT